MFGSSIRFLKEKEMPSPKTVKIRDVAPRDGFQSWPEFVPTDKKLDIIESIRQAGVGEIEITSFFNHLNEDVFVGGVRNGKKSAANEIFLICK